ncbi:CLUMA_CG005043, isoform A [Clunio marinus]|uniref:CLUMA_CG005043, isoform A n=1 Tax=Clunio marinus TaxID=568069 RepID=A0A1J1HV04_9DIPT|nr:CLUMA_CG005043, isoform A [Clunio marinus]
MKSRASIKIELNILCWLRLNHALAFCKMIQKWKCYLYDNLCFNIEMLSLLSVYGTVLGDLTQPQIMHRHSFQTIQLPT